MKILWNVIRVGICVIVCTFTLLGDKPVLAQCEWSALSEHLANQGDERSKRASENLNHLCTSVKLIDIQRSAAAQKCLGSSTRIFTETDQAILGRAFGATGRQTLRVLIPGVAAFFSRPLVGIVGALLIPQSIARDPIDTISNPDRASRTDLNEAARFLIWNTDPSAFKNNLSAERKAAVNACLLVQ